MNTLKNTFNESKSYFPFSNQAEQKPTLLEICKKAIFNDFHIDVNFTPSIIASNGFENVFTNDFSDTKYKNLHSTVWIQNVSKKNRTSFK